MINNEEETIKKTSIFDMVKIIESKIPWKDLTDEQQKSYSVFMMNRLFSSREMYAPIISKLDTLKMTSEQHYTFLCNIVDRKLYLDLKSYKKQKESPEDKLLIYALSKEFEIGNREAKSYINIINVSEKEKLIKKWKDYYELYGENK